MIVAPDHGRGHGQGIEDRFIRCLDRRGEQKIQMGIGECRDGIGGFLWIVRNDGCGRKCEDEVAAAVPDGRVLSARPATS